MELNLTYERIKEPADLEVLKEWLEDIELLRLARMRETPLEDEDFKFYLDTLSYFICLEGVPIGYCRIFETADPEVMEIGIIIAEPEYWKKGIGTIVGKKLIATCMACGATKILWATTEYNKGSIELAEKLGFKPIERLGCIEFNKLPYRVVVYALEV